MNHIIQNFTQAIGQAAGSVGLVTPEQTQAAMLLQAKGLILAQKHPQENISQWTPLAETIEKIYAAEAVPEEMLRQAVMQIQTAANKTGSLPSNAPYFKDCLLEVEPNLQAHLNPMLAAQAAARTIHSITANEDNRDLNAVITDTRTLKDDPNEPEYIRASQSLNYLTDIMTAAIRQNPSLANDPQIQTALMSAEMLAAQSLKRAAEAMEHTPGNGAKAAMQMRAARESLRGEVNMLSRTLATSVHVGKLQRGLEAVAQAMPEQETAIRNASRNHGRRVNELKVAGSLVNVFPDSWLSRVRPGGQQLQREGRHL